MPSRKKGRQIMSRPRLKEVVGLLTGHTTFRVHRLKFRLTQRQNFRLRGDEREESVHIVCHCAALTYERYRTLCIMFVKSKDLENTRMNHLRSFVASTNLGIVIYPI
jgi:hypothetical protein